MSSSNVDNRIVEMQFDNKDFERNIADSMKTLEQFRKSLKLEDATKGFDQLDKASEKAFKQINNSADSVNFSKIAEGIDYLAKRFSFLGEFVHSTFSRITNQMTSMVTGAVKSMSVDQIGAGFNKYATVTDAVATMRYALGDSSSVKEIYEAVHKLNTYSDETSYDLAAMTSNLSMFISSGRGLDEATTAIMGIGNASALAGVSVSKANIVMKNFSDALAMGHLQLSDWKSMEYAGFAAKQIKEAFIEAGIELGKTDKKGYLIGSKNFAVDANNFRNSLNEGWVDAEVMMKVLEKFANNEDAFDAAKVAKTWGEARDSITDAISTGWMQTFELVFGNLDEASKLWTDVANQFIVRVTSPIAEARNAILQEWKDLGGREKLLSITSRIFDMLFGLDPDDESKKVSANLKDTIAGVWTSVFGKYDGIDLLRATEKVRAGVASFQKWFYSDTAGDGHSNLENIGRIFEGFFSSFAIFKSAVSGIVGGVSDFIKALMPDTVGNVLEFVGDLGESIHTFFTDKLQNGKVFDNLRTDITNFLKDMTKDFPAAIGKLKEGLVAFFDRIVNSKTFAAIKENLKGLWASFKQYAPKALKTFGSAVAKVIEKIPSAMNKVLDFIKSIREWFKTNETIKSWSEKIKNFLSPVTDFFGKVKNKIKEALDSENPLEVIKTAFNNFIERVKTSIKESDLFKSFQEKFESLKSKLAPYWESVKNFFAKMFSGEGIIGKIKGFFSGILESIKGFLASDNKGTQIKEFFSGIWDSVKNFFGSNEKVAAIKDFFKGLWSSVKEFFSNIGKGDATEGAKSFGEKFKEFFTSVGNGLKAFGEAVTGIDFASLITKAIDIAKKVYLLKVTWDAVHGFKGIGDIGKSLGQILKKKAGIETDTIGTTFLKIAGALTMVAAVVGILGALPPDVIDRGMANVLKIGALITTMYLTATLLQGANRFKDITAGVTFLGIAGSIAMIGASAAILGVIPTNILQKGAAAVLQIALLIEAMLVVNQFISRIPGGTLSTGWQSMIGMAGAIAILAAATAFLGFMKKEQLDRGTNAIFGLSLIIAGLVTLNQIIGSKFPGQPSKITGLIGFAVAVAGLAFVAAQLGKIPDDQLLKGVGSVAILGLLLIGMSAIGKGTKLTSVLPTLANAAIVCVAMEVFAHALKQLPADMEWSTIMAFAGGLTLAVAGIGAAMALIGSMAGPVLAGAGTLAGVMVILGLAFATLAGFANVGVQSASTAIFSLGSTISTFSDLVGDVDKGKIDQAFEALKVINEMVLAAAAIGPVDLNGYLTTIRRLSVNLQMFNTAVSGVDLASIQNAKAANDVVIEMVSSIVALGDVTEATSYGSTIQTIGANLQLYNTAVSGIDIGAITTAKQAADLIGATVTSLLGSGVTEFPDVSVNIGYLGAALKTYFTDVAGIDTSTVPDPASIKAAFDGIATALPEDTVFETMNSLADDSEGSKGDALVKFALGLTNLKGALDDYASVCESINVDRLTEANGIITDLAGVVAQLPTSTTFSFDFLGINATIESKQTDLNTFSTDITLLGDAMNNFATSCDGINVENAKTAAGVLKDLAEVTREMPISSSFSFSFLGFSATIESHKEDLGTFSENVTSLGNSLNEFIKATQDIDAGKVNSATQVLKDISELKIPTTGGLWTLIAGDDSLASFASQMSILGDGFAQFAQKVNAEGVKFTNVQDAAAVVGVLSEIQNSLGTSGGILQAFSGTKTFDNLSGNLEKLGSGIASFGTSTSGVEFDGASAAADIIKKLAEAQSAMEKVGGVSSWFEGSNDLSSLANQLKGFVTVIKENTDLLNQVAWSAYDTAVTKIDDIVKIQEKLKTGELNFSGITEMGNQIVAFSSILTSGGFNSEAITSVADAINQIASNFPDEAYTGAHDSGTTFVTKMIEGINEQAETVSTTVRDITVSAAAAIAEHYGDFSESGSYVAEGFAAGIASNKSAVAQARKLARLALEAMRQTLDEHSPSRITEKYGEFFSDGLNIGIEEGGQAVLNTSRDLGNDTLAMLATPLSQISDTIDSPMQSFAGEQRNFWEEMCDAVNDGFDSIRSGTFDVGKALNNVANGVEQGGKTVRKAASNLGNDVAEEISQPISEISQAVDAPLDALASHYSHFWAEVGDAINDGLSSAEDTSKDLVTSADIALRDVGKTVESIQPSTVVQTAEQALSDLTTAVENTDLELPVKPVAKDSTVTTEEDVDITSSLSKKESDTATSQEEMVAKILETIENSKIAELLTEINTSVNEVKEYTAKTPELLTSVVDNLNEAVESWGSMQVSLDGKTLVGSLISDIDAGLGERAGDRARGN